MIFDTGRVVFGQAQVERAEGGHSPADPHGPVDPVPVKGLELLGEDLPDVTPDLLQLDVCGRVSAHEPLGQADASKLQAHELRALFPLAAYDLGASAPDIHDDRAAVGRVEAAHDGQEYEAGFFFPGQDIDGVPDALGVVVGDVSPIAG